MKTNLLAVAVLFASTIANAQDPVPSPPPDFDVFKVSALLGASVSMSSNADTLLTPIAKISASGPLAFGSIPANKLPRLHVSGELSALPGDAIDQAAGISGTLSQFKSLDFSIGVSQRISKWLPLGKGNQEVATSVYVEAGFATRLDGEQKARDKAPRYGCVGFRFDERVSDSSLKTGLCADQRLDGSYQVTTTITGLVTAFEFGAGAGSKAGVAVYVKAILGVDASSPTRPGLTGSRRDAVSVGSLVGW